MRRTSAVCYHKRASYSSLSSVVRNHTVNCFFKFRGDNTNACVVPVVRKRLWRCRAFRTPYGTSHAVQAGAAWRCFSGNRFDFDPPSLHVELTCTGKGAMDERDKIPRCKENKTVARRRYKQRILLGRAAPAAAFLPPRRPRSPAAFSRPLLLLTPEVLLGEEKKKN